MILVNGDSFSRGNISWAYQLGIPQSDIVNLAQSGAGNNYICDTTIVELSKRTYDYVLIMWTSLDRYDLQIEDVSQFSKTFYTSQYQSSVNDWVEKIIDPVNDQDFVQKNWIFGCGHINNDIELHNIHVFDKIYRYCGDDQFIQNSLVKMISLQSYLKINKIP